jgi:hypothetical protein
MTELQTEINRLNKILSEESAAVYLEIKTYVWRNYEQQMAGIDAEIQSVDSALNALYDKRQAIIKERDAEIDTLHKRETERIFVPVKALRDEYRKYYTAAKKSKK